MQNNTTHTISFAIFDDLRSIVSITKKLPKLNFKSIHKILNEIIKGIEDIDYHDRNLDGLLTRSSKRSEIVEDLLNDKYTVYNRVNKYYVLAIALDYTRFDIYSKDCDKVLIKWRDNDENDPIVGVIENPNYNENPVASLMRNLQTS
jgi:hypothetical protein